MTEVSAPTAGYSPWFATALGLAGILSGIALTSFMSTAQVAQAEPAPQVAAIPAPVAPPTGAGCGQ